MRKTGSVTTVTVNCTGTVHDVTFRDGTFGTSAHDVADLHAERAAFGFDPTFEMSGCAAVLHAWITGDRDRLPSPWQHLHDDADQRRWRREQFPDEPHRFYDPIGRDGDAWEDTLRAWRLTQRIATQAAVQFAATQTRRFRTVGGGNRSVYVAYHDGRYCYVEGKTDLSGVGVTVKVHPRWVREVARHGLACPAVARHWFVTDVDAFDDDGRPSAGRAATWQHESGWRHRDRSLESRAPDFVIRSRDVKFSFHDNHWTVQPLPDRFDDA